MSTFTLLALAPYVLIALLALAPWCAIAATAALALVPWALYNVYLCNNNIIKAIICH